MAGNQEDGTYLPAHDSDDSEPQNPDTAAKQKSPPPKSSKRQVFPRTTNTPKPLERASPKPPQTPKSAQKVTTRTPVPVSSQRTAPQPPPTPPTPKILKTPKSAKNDTTQSPISVKSQPPKSSASKKAKVEKPKDNVTSCIPSLDPLPSDIDLEDKRYWLCNRQDRVWMRRDANGLDKRQLTAALKYYIRPTHQAGVKLDSKTKPVLLIGVKQVYLDRDDDAKWDEDQLRNCNGMSGADYEQKFLADGRLPKTPKQAPKKTKAAPKKAKAESKKPKSVALNPKPQGESSVEGGKKLAESHRETRPMVTKLKQLKTPQNQQESNSQRQRAGTRSGQLDERSRRFVEEAIRDTLSALMYHDLNRHPLAYHREPVRAGIVASREDFQKVIPAAFSANSGIYLQFLQDHSDYAQWNPHWRIADAEEQVESYPIRGRGPVWSDNSCAIDACIVAGMLLDAGSTIADRQNGWPSALSRLEDEFLEVVEKNWSIMTREQSIAERNNFWKKLHREQREQEDKTAEAKTIESKDWRIGRMQSPLTVWQLCTANFQQLHFQYFSRTGKCANCTREGPRTGTVPTNSITPTYPQVASLTLQDALQEYFSVSKTCEACNIGTVVRDKMVIGELPLRLAIFPDKRCAITEHTRNVQFHHRTVDPVLWPADAGENASRPDPPSTTTNVEYRWLGGIYYHKKHFRVYWTDISRQEPDQGHFKVYDGMCAEGAIVGQIPPAHATERIHPDWVNQGAQTILFYEKVLSPTTEVLHVAAETITSAQGGASFVSTAPLDFLRPIDHLSGRKNLSHRFVKGGLFRPISLDNFPALQQNGIDAGDLMDLISDGSGTPLDNPSKKGGGAARQGTGVPPTGAQPPTADVNTIQNPPAKSEPPPPALNTIVMYPAVIIEPSDYVAPPVQHFAADDFDPQIQNRPEPTQDEMFPRGDLGQIQPRQRRTPAPDTCMECGGPPEGTQYITFKEPKGATLYLHNGCFQCRRCRAQLNEGDVGADINRKEIAVWHGPMAEFDGGVLCQVCGEHLDRLEERATKAEDKGKRKSEGWGEPAPKRVNRSGCGAINELVTEGERLLQGIGDDELDEVEDQEKDGQEEGEDVDEEWRRKEAEKKAKRRERDKKKIEEKKEKMKEAEAEKKKSGESEKEAAQKKENQEEEEEGKKEGRKEEKKKKKKKRKKREMEDDSWGESIGESEDESEDSGVGEFVEEENEDGEEDYDEDGEERDEDEKEGNGDDHGDNDELENDPQNDNQDGPQGSQDQSKDQPQNEPEEEPEDDSHEPGEHPQDWQDWTQDIRITEPGVEQNSEPKCLVCGEYIDPDLSLMSASEYAEAVRNGDDLDGQSVVRFDEVSGEKLYIHFTCWICAHCDDSASIFSSRVRSGNIRCGFRAHDIQKNKAKARKEPKLTTLGAQWSAEFVGFNELQARDFETEGEKEEQNSAEKERAEWMEEGVERQRAEWYQKEKAEKAKQKEEMQSRLHCVDISSEAKEPDMKAALGDEASKLPPPMELDLPEEVQRAFEIPGLDALGYVPHIPDTEGVRGSIGTLKRKMSKDSLFDDEDDRAEGEKDRDAVAEDVNEDKEQGPSAKRQKSETVQQDRPEEDSLFD